MARIDLIFYARDGTDETTRRDFTNERRSSLTTSSPSLRVPERPPVRAVVRRVQERHLRRVRRRRRVLPREEKRRAHQRLLRRRQRPRKQDVEDDHEVPLALPVRARHPLALDDLPVSRVHDLRHRER
eukprot:31523-Pelagococcus_subviridis.AAC.7